jgi:phosphoglycerate dehydrogenase-like enzyme
VGDELQVLIYEKSFPRIEERLRAELPAVRPVLMREDGSLIFEGRSVQAENLAAESLAAKVAWANTDVYIGGPVVAFMVFCLKSQSLRWVQSSAAGFDHPVFGMLVDKGVVLTNSNAAAVAIAEYVMAGVLDHFQPNRERRGAQADKQWKRLRFKEIHGTTWLVIGIGNIGGEIARRAAAFGAHMIGVRRHPSGEEPAHEIIEPDGLPAAVPRADVVVLAAPSNEQSQHIVDSAFLAAMSPTSTLINVGRGNLVDEQALLESLQRGVPEHAILDVFETEPLPTESPLWSHPRVVVTAHNAPNSEGFRRRNDSLFLDNLKRYLSGQPLKNVVDPKTVRQSVQGNREIR